MKTEPADLLWIEVPSDAVAIDLGVDCVPRIEKLAALTRSLDQDSRRRLAIVQEVMVRELRKGNVRYAGHLVRRVEGPAPRLSIAQLYVTLTPARCGDPRILDSIAGRLGSGGDRESGLVDLPAGRGLAVAETVAVGARSRVWHGRVVLLPRVGSFVVTVGLATSCVWDRGADTGLLARVAHSITFEQPLPPTGSSYRGRIADALDGSAPA